MIRREKKTRKKRGYEMHSGLRRRGAGNRGGRGNAGVGKKGSQKVTKLLAMGIKLGKRKGFVNHNKREIKSINLGELMKHVKNGVADAVSLGYDKVLGKGHALPNVTVKAKYITEKAKQKIESANGKVVVM